MSLALALLALLPFTTAQISTYNTGCLNPTHLAITIDDGPSPTTTELLTKLSSAGLKATLFLIGANAQNFPTVVRQALEQGHQIAGHSFTHPDFVTISEDQVRKEVGDTDAVLSKILSGGDRVFSGVNYFRYPYGSHSEATDRVLKSMGKVPVFWNVDSNDWQSVTSNSIVDSIRKGIESGKGVISLHHDFSVASMDALIGIKELAREKGVKFVTVDECLGYPAVKYGGDVRVELAEDTSNNNGDKSTTTTTTASSPTIAPKPDSAPNTNTNTNTKPEVTHNTNTNTQDRKDPTPPCDKGTLAVSAPGETNPMHPAAVVDPESTKVDLDRIPTYRLAATRASNNAISISISNSLSVVIGALAALFFF